ncbi:hypothetical protein BKA69DRAFT_415838 [Paraphysoderma sedebokerense]|nr:hypothetical protein BKA69DRAFT_415838 [Paraphysoderma sedebokerense]
MMSLSVRFSNLPVFFLILSVISTVIVSGSDSHSGIPKITVQSKVIEDWYQPGSSSTEFVKCSASRVVITISKSVNQTSVAEIPYANETVSIKVQERTLPVIITQSNRLVKTVFQKDRIYEFKTNPAGRVAFSIPITDDEDKSSDNKAVRLHLSPILIRSAFMKTNSWVAVHPDSATFHQLTSIQPVNLININKELSEKKANDIHQMIQKIAKTSLSSTPVVTLTAKSGGLKKRWLRKSADTNSPYLPESDILAKHLFSGQRSHRYERIVSPSPEPWSFSVQNGGLNISFGRTSRKLMKRDFADIMEGVSNATANIIESIGGAQHSSTKEMELFSNDSHLVFVVKDMVGKVKEFILDTVEMAVSAFQAILQYIKVGVKSILEALRKTFRWDAVLRSTKFLKMYIYGTMAHNPTLLQHQDSKIEEFGMNLTRSAHSSINNVTKRLGGEIPLSSLPFRIQSNSNSSRQQHTKPNSSISSTEQSLVEDLLVNNIQSAKLETNDSVIKNITSIASRIFEALSSEGLLKNPALNETRSKLVVFQEGTNIFSKSASYIMASVLVLFQSIQKIFTKSLQLSIKFTQMIDDFMMTILTFKLKIPLLTEFYNNVIALKTHELTLGDTLFLMSGAINVFNWMIYHKGNEPITEKEMKVFESEPNSMLWRMTYVKHELLNDVKENDRLKKINVLLKFFPQGLMYYITWVGLVMVNLPDKLFSRLLSGMSAPITFWLLCKTFFPLQQSTSSEPAELTKLIHNTTTFDVVFYIRWYPLILIKILTQFHPAFRFDNTLSSHLVAATFAAPQGIIYTMLLKMIHDNMDWTNWKRVAIWGTLAGGFFFDTISWFCYLLPAGKFNNAGRDAFYVMLTFYSVLHHLKLGFGDMFD